MIAMSSMPNWAENEEMVNACTHAIGIGMSFFFFYDAIRAIKKDADAKRTIGKLIFAISSLFLYANSTIYHGLPMGKLKVIWRYVDHITIYALIIGSYTPIALNVVGGKLGWALLIWVWTCGIAGTALKILYFDGFFNISLVLYLGMGWSILIGIKRILKERN